MNIIEMIGAFIDRIFRWGPKWNASPQVNNHVDNVLRDENGGVYTNFKEEAEMNPNSGKEVIYYSDDDEYDYSDDEEYDYSDDEEYDYSEDEDYDYSDDEEYDYSEDEDYDYSDEEEYS